MGTAVEIDSVSKHFKLYHQQASSLKERVIRFGRTEFEEFWALKDVSISIEQGSTFGLLGHNGSGKSTLLKCVAGILRPTSGRILKSGRTAALLELGSGFHPELTGRENIYLNGSILGLTRVEVARIFDEVVAFSEIGRFIDNQVKYYSSGMYARLAFALAVHVDPELVVIDEVLAVGDEAFQRKCMRRIKQFQREGRTIVLVTHAADVVRQICDSAAVLDHGQLVQIGAPADAVKAFRESLRQKGIDLPPEAQRLTDAELDWQHNKQLFFTDVRITNGNGDRVTTFRPRERCRVEVQFDTRMPIDDVVISLHLTNSEGDMLMATNTLMLGGRTSGFDGPGSAVFTFDPLTLGDGVYPLLIGAHSKDSTVLYDHRDDKDRIEVGGADGFLGSVALPVTLEFPAGSE